MVRVMNLQRTSDAIFLDYRKAFDSVPHAPLIGKLVDIGLHSNLLAWVTDYLTNRFQQVVVDGAWSHPAHVTSGVPQGSVLGPLLFSIYINSITELPLSPQSSRVLYADDALLYRPISHPDDFLAVQSDINMIKGWSDEHLLQLNPTKCKYMILSKKKSPVQNGHTLSLGSSVLEEVETFKYLGVLIKNNLSWSDHITGVCNKARQILGLLYRQFYMDSPADTLKQLYLSLVRPHLEYAAQLWDPYAQRDIYKLESVQKFALKLVTHQWDSSYDELLSLVNVPKLSVRRQNFKLAQVFKIVHGFCYFPDNIFRMQPSHSSRLSRIDTIYRPFARTNYYYHSFVPSSIAAWNALDDRQVDTQSLSAFKLMIKL